MKYKKEILHHYLSIAPAALAIERYLECNIYMNLPLERPILDLGCGEGIFASVLFAEKIDTGIDPNQKELDRATELDAYCELIKCSGDKIPKPDGSFKTVFSNSVLEHIPDLSPVFTEVNRILANDGVFYFTVPSNKFDRYSVISTILSNLKLEKIAQKYQIFYDRFWKHYHFYSLQGWQDLIKPHGFEVIQAFEYDPAPICRLNDSLVVFSFIPRVIKMITNRWYVFPFLRSVLIKPFIAILEKYLNTAHHTDEGGLVFVAARKIS